MYRLRSTGWLAAFVCIATAACRGGGPPAASTSVSIAHRIGWVDSGCLAIDNESLMPGSPVSVVTPGREQTIVQTTVVRAATVAERCAPLAADRRAINAGSGVFFYELAAAEGRAADGIAILGPVARVETGLDITGDRKPEQFTRCTTSEGISFGVWSAMPYQEPPLWSGYYYLGYDTEPDCPET